MMDKQWLHSMMAYCSRAEHCVNDIRDKLRVSDVSSDETEEILQALIEGGYVDEQRYANAFVNDKFKFNKWGKIKIAHALQQKKVPSSCIEKALDGLDNNAYEDTLRKLIESKQKCVKGTATQMRAAVIRFALSRGFEYELVQRLMR